MSVNKTHESHSRGDHKPNWNQEQASSDQEERKDQGQQQQCVPRRNRDINPPKQPFKAKFVPRQHEDQKNRTKGDNRDNRQYKYKKEYRNEKPNNQKEQFQSRQQNRKNEKFVEKDEKKETTQRTKREVGRDVNKTNNNSQRQKDVNNREDYSIQQLPRKPLPNYTNKIEITSNDTQKYVKQARQMLNKFDFMTLQARNHKIGFAFNIAQAIVKQIKNLDRVNIPATDKIQYILHPRHSDLREKRETKYIPMIIIELSKKQLTNRHIGHQSYKNKQQAANYKRPQRREKKRYQEKVQTKQQ